MDKELVPLIKLAYETNCLLEKLVKSASIDRPYNQFVQAYTVPLQIPLAKGCFAYMFTNIGDTDATVNGMIVHPSVTPTTRLGDSRTISGHRNEIYTGNITLAFLPTLGATNPNVEIVQLFYV